MTHTITITTLSRPVDGYTHRVRTPALRSGVLVSSIEDARKVAAGYTPTAGETVGIVETTEAAAKAKVRAEALGLAESVRIPL